MCSDSLQVSALSSAGGTENLILLEQEKHRPHEVGSVQWAGSTFGPMQKSRLGEHEFEALMRMLDNLVSVLVLSSDCSMETEPQSQASESTRDAQEPPLSWST